MILHIALLLAGLWFLPADFSQAAEARCDELGANCICGNQLQGTTLTPLNGGVWWAVNDATAKPCNGEGVPTGIITRDSGGGPTDMTSSTDATALSALPAGHSVSRFIRAPEGHVGNFQFGHTLASGDPHARVALRWYRYYSPNFEFASEHIGWLNDGVTGCHASKIAQSSYGAIIDAHADSMVGQYGYASNPAWSPSLDCCGGGPICASGDSACSSLMSSLMPRGTGWGNVNTCNYGSTSGGPPTSGNCGWGGTWMRFELIIGNATGSPGVYYLFYAKNITTNSAERQLIDTRVPGPNFAQAWTTAAATTLTPPGRIDTLWMNGFRQAQCNGWNGVSHVMMAAWSTDSGQRIGAATEIESGAGGGSPVKGSLGGAIKAVGGVRLF